MKYNRYIQGPTKRQILLKTVKRFRWWLIRLVDIAEKLVFFQRNMLIYDFGVPHKIYISRQAVGN